MEENKELNEEVKETEESNTGLESGGSNPELESGLESDVETIDVKLQNEIDELKSEVDRLKNAYAKAYADTENVKKRLQNEADTNKKYRIQSFAKEILPAIDNLERAMAASDESESQLKKGVEMIYNQLIKSLKDEGVEEIDCLNKKFDPNFEQSIMVEKKEGVEPGVVIEVLQKGYMLKDRVLRAAMVKISE
ncbi:MAG: nucleotide exchange factor GrpE [Erysipelotrichaceae bacterium]|nr:nucleotide exchange factor GrpE [Solobacterium sp.]MDY3794196.1 nucleotide exchange factor GrpE [Erysipelotrichaceae bacterium]